jgi:hypothetical protein
MTVTLTSTTSSKEEMEHAVSDNWREPFVPPTVPVKDEAAPETDETPVKTADESETPETTESEKAKPKSKYQRTIDKLTARNHAAETRAEQLQRELEEERAKHKPADSKAAPATPQGPPKLQDFLNAGKTADEWADARDAWKQDQEVKQAQAEQLKATFDAYNKGVSEARGRYEDWDSVVEGNENPIPESVKLAVLEMDNGPDVAYHLGKHPELCAELMEMSPLSAVRKIGQVADSLKPSERSPAPKPKVTPPTPIAPVGGSSSRSSVPLDQLPPREYNRIRNAQERANRGR